jgi:hypothetical protein
MPIGAPARHKSPRNLTESLHRRTSGLVPTADVSGGAGTVADCGRASVRFCIATEVAPPNQPEVCGAPRRPPRSASGTAGADQRTTGAGNRSAE